MIFYRTNGWTRKILEYCLDEGHIVITNENTLCEYYSLSSYGRFDLCKLKPLVSGVHPKSTASHESLLEFYKESEVLQERLKPLSHTAKICKK